MNVKLYFDGGSKGKWVPDPGSLSGGNKRVPVGYGSYEIVTDDDRLNTLCRVTIGQPATCNEAEYLSFMAGLDHLVSLLLNNQIEVADTNIEIWSDSMLVVQQVGGSWRARKPELVSLRNACCDVLACFGSFQTRWHSRVNNVKRFGH